MFGGKAWKIFSVRGVPIRVDTSWVVMTAFVVFTWWASASAEGVSDGTALMLAVFIAVLFFGSILFHEGAHATMCRMRGIHVESITLFALGGYTSAHLDEKNAKEEFLVAVVGPLASLVLGVAMLFAAQATHSSYPDFAHAVERVGGINVLLAAFNILPAFPLDGGRVLKAAVLGASGNRRLAAKVAGWSGQVAAAGMILYGLLSMSGTIAGPFNGVFLILVAFLILQGARGTEKREELMLLLEGATVADAMTAPPAAVPADATLTEALDRHLRGHEDKMFPVVEGRKLVGLLTFQAAARVGQHDPMSRVSAAMSGLGDVKLVQADTTLTRALAELGGGSALVLRGEDLVGSLTVNDVGRVATARSRQQWIPPRPDIPTQP